MFDERQPQGFPISFITCPLVSSRCRNHLPYPVITLMPMCGFAPLVSGYAPALITPLHRSLRKVGPGGGEGTPCAGAPRHLPPREGRIWPPRSRPSWLRSSLPFWGRSAAWPTQHNPPFGNPVWAESIRDCSPLSFWIRIFVTSCSSIGSSSRKSVFLLLP